VSLPTAIDGPIVADPSKQWSNGSVKVRVENRSSRERTAACHFALYHPVTSLLCLDPGIRRERQATSSLSYGMTEQLSKH
jgi:hypothetical protein